MIFQLKNCTSDLNFGRDTPKLLATSFGKTPLANNFFAEFTLLFRPSFFAASRIEKIFLRYFIRIGILLEVY